MAAVGVLGTQRLHLRRHCCLAMFAVVLACCASATPSLAAPPQAGPPPPPPPPARIPPVDPLDSAPVADATVPRSVDGGADLNAKLRQRGDLVLTDTTLRQALFTISESWHINLVVGEDVSGQVNGVFKNAPLHEILHSILYANGYGYRVVGQGLVVMKLTSLGDANPLFETAAIVLSSIKPEDVVEGANLLRSPQGKVTAIPSARALMVVDFPERITAIRNFVKQVDDSASGAGGAQPHAERQVAQFMPQFVKVVNLKDSLDTILSKDGKAVIIEAENRVIVVDYPLNLKLAEQVVRNLDQARPQVRITALIYDVSLEDLERLGINWNHAVKANNTTAQGLPASAWAIDSLTQVPAATGTPAAAMTFMNLSRNFDINATINALCESKDALLLADPSVTVIDREPASIQIVTEIPYQQLTQTQQGGQIGTTAFRDAGITLKVLPHIADNGTVELVVTPTFSRLTGFTNGQNPQPIIDKREAQTTVRVANHQWFVIGGLRQRTAVKNDRGVPGLDNIKYVNKLFSSFDHNFRESELIVFLMPEMVTPEYAGKEREQIVLGASESMLDETPIAPHVLGPGEVGCVNCGKKNGCLCRSRGKENGQANGECEDCDANAQPTAPGTSSSGVRRLPRIDGARGPAPLVTARPEPAKPSSMVKTPTPAVKAAASDRAAGQKAMGSPETAKKAAKPAKATTTASSKSSSWFGNWW